MAQELTDGDISTLLRSMPTGPCWSGHLYLGSMFVLDFGDRLLFPRSKGFPVLCGTSTLSVRNCYWVLLSNSERIAAADSITGVAFDSTVMPRLIGASLDATCTAPHFEHTNLLLSNNCRLELDVSRRWETDGVLAEITLQNGQYVQLESSGRWYLAADAELYRRHRWENRSSK